MEQHKDTIRYKLAKVLGLTEQKSMYGYSQTEDEVKDLSWEELFFEVGKLVNRKNDLALEKLARDNEREIEKLSNDILEKTTATGVINKFNRDNK